MITDAAQADQIVRNGEADLVFLAREMLRDPYWAAHSAAKLSQKGSWPVQYLRAAPQGSTPREPLVRPA
jgi:2,4-dienoyl-CoA reductase-like NADH-dependent reductase (Old Yellow Enzyme family)